MKFVEEQESEKIEDIGADEIRAAKQQEKKEDIKAKETKGAFKKLSWFRSIKQKLAITLDKILEKKNKKKSPVAGKAKDEKGQNIEAKEQKKVIEAQVNGDDEKRPGPVTSWIFATGPFGENPVHSGSPLPSGFLPSRR